ncbi:MAG: hypothetical protein IJY27_04530 [Clostridia bacterium]|nr:hypothetical protein [Clostridia bacterium]
MKNFALDVVVDPVAEFMFSPWPWVIAGVLVVAAVVGVVLFMKNKNKK